MQRKSLCLTSSHPHVQQRGVALFVVIVFVMLSMLLALWASRTSLFNEMVVGNDADYQRAFEAAQALLQDAELDIRGENSDGTPCGASLSCRDNQAGAFKIPQTSTEAIGLLEDLDQQTTKCANALCTKRSGRQDFWNASGAVALQPGENRLADMTKDTVGARYGQYTGATVGTSTSPANPILADRSADNQGGWYWIEVLQYSKKGKTSGLIVESANSNSLVDLTPQANVVYRITALAYGRKPGTVAVLQQTYVRQTRDR